MIRRPPRSTQSRSSAASDVYKRQDEDRVLEVVAAPRHERDEHVPTERQLAELGARPVAEHLALGHLLADAHDRLLVDAGILVRALELGEVVDVGAHLLADIPVLAVHADDHALAVHVVHGTRPPGHDNGARVARGDVLHAGADERRPGAEPVSYTHLTLPTIYSV